VNYFGVVEGVWYALPYLKKSNRGKIVAVSSLVGKFGAPTRTCYSGSKWAVQGFLEALRCELAPKYGIEITIICPGAVRTDINEHRLGSPQHLLDMSKALPVEEAARKIVKAVSEGKREEVFLHGYGFVEVLRQYCPELGDRILIHGVKAAHHSAKKDS